MTSFWLIQMDHSVANMSCHSATLRYGPSPMDRHKSSSNVSSGRATPTDHQTAWEMGHKTKRCSESSIVAPHNAVPYGVGGHAVSKGSRDQPLAEKEPDKDPYLQRNSAFPHPSPDSQEKRVFQIRSFLKSKIDYPNSKILAAPYPRVRARGQSLISH